IFVMSIVVRSQKQIEQPSAIDGADEFAKARRFRRRRFFCPLTTGGSSDAGALEVVLHVQELSVALDELDHVHGDARRMAHAAFAARPAPAIDAVVAER